MEFVGRRVKKVLDGHRSIFGVIRGYEQATGFCEIVYDGGDSEEVHLSGVYSLLVALESPRGAAVEFSNEGRRVGNEGYGGFDLNVPAFNSLNNDGNHGCDNVVGDGADLCGLDLNVALNLDMDDGLCLNTGFDEERLGVKKEVIDLNLDPSEGCENFGGRKEIICFDLNSEYVEDAEMNLIDFKEQFEGVCTEGDVEVTMELGEDDGAQNIRNPNRGDDGPLKRCATGVGNENLASGSAQRKRKGKRRKVSSHDAELVTPELPKVDLQAGGMEFRQESREGASQENGIPEVVKRGRKGRKIPKPGTGSRQTSCKKKRAAESNPEQDSNAPGLDGVNHQFSSPLSVMSDEKVVVALAACEKSPSCPVLPPKVELPPSSCNLDLSAISVLDIVSVFAFLRSFSTLLFLSPFELDDFVTSVKSNDSTLLFDSIHLSLLRTLRKHLESLCAEGSDSASNCLRSLNWDLLDLITWPLYAYEYLLMHSSGCITTLNVCRTKYYLNDYYKLPVSTKVDILLQLCDDVIEAEAFRSEMNQRMLATDRSTERVMNNSNKRKPGIGVTNVSCITEDNPEEPTDGNSDECSLCKMDGNLICCDGCPAAFHSRCVGVVSSMLPEGVWFCPECMIENDKPWTNLRKAVRGAELVGNDPYGRAFYSSCGYLLVLESCNGGYSSRFYCRNDLAILINALESSPCIYETIITAIRKEWNVVHEICGARNDFDDRSYSIQSAFPENRCPADRNPSASETISNSGAFVEKSSHEKITAPANSSYTEVENAGQGNVLLEIETHRERLENYFESPEGSAEASQTYTKTDTLNEIGLACSEKCPEILQNFRSPGNPINVGDHSIASISVFAEKEKNISFKSYSCAPDNTNSVGMLSQVHYASNYVNFYEFAKTASSYFEEMTCKSSDRTSEDSEKSIEEILTEQLKFVTNRLSEFSWSNIQTSKMGSRRERCGWCYYCRVPEDDRDCVFVMNDSMPAVENYTCYTLGIQSRKNDRNHLVDVRCHIICIENHLHGLLLGPWLNPEYSILWQESVLRANDITSLKNLLIQLESNMHHQALTTEWRKHMDSAITMGSGFHFVRSSKRASLKHGIGRKRPNPSKVETAPSSKVATGMRLFWWRGGQISRMLFNWKVLPHSLASKAARQGGRKKIPGILYPESGEYAKRSKYVSWRAAVEASRSVEQLALQVRELDAQIRWDDIGNRNLLSKLGMDSKKSAESFKNVIIRSKCSEGAVVKYLLDFGKRRFIPDVVMRHGSELEGSSNERKEYWLEEPHLPLHLLKAFEETRIAQDPGKLGDSSGVIKRPKTKGFSYLFSRAERT